MKPEEIIERLVKQRILESLERPPIFYLALDPEWEELIQGGDE